MEESKILMLLEQACNPSNEIQRQIYQTVQEWSQNPSFLSQLVNYFSNGNNNYELRYRAGKATPLIMPKGVIMKAILRSVNYDIFPPEYIQYISERLIASTND
jgi:hypothetical protein